MSKRTVPVLIAGCILALAGLAGYVMPSSPTEEPTPRLLMENAGGRVVFTHKAHSTPGGAYGDNACLVCHHDLKIAAAPEGAKPEVKACGACHGTEDVPDFVAVHQVQYRAQGDSSCLSCHHTVFTGYSDKWNHEEHASVYAGEDCASCHHPLRYEFKPGRVMNIKPQKCANCHTAKPNPMTATTLKDAAHARCITCHEDLFEQKLKACGTCHARSQGSAGQDGQDASYPACATCHGPIPAKMESYHAQCMGCHDSAGKGPGKAAPCAQCHTP